MWGSSRYIAVMSLASVVALVRGFVVAGILDLASFGLYATVVATGMFLSALVSFGEIERTIKTFPRLWMVERHRSAVIDQADKSARIMLVRAGGLLILLLACSGVDAMRHFAQMAMFAVLIALNVALASLYASAIRATGEIELMAWNTLLRALIVIIFGISGAYFFEWQGAILGEVLAAVLGVFITRHSVLRKAGFFLKNDNLVYEDKNKKNPSDNGLWLFIAGLLTSAPVYLDRTFVGSVFGSEMAGIFGFLMLFVAGANTFTGIIAQKIGPQIIKMEYSGRAVNEQIKFAVRWMVLIFAMSVMGMAVVALLLFLGSLQYFVEKFHLNFNLIAATAAMCCLQIGAILDFILISKNKERAIFFSACGYLSAIGCVVFLVFFLNLTLVHFIWLLTFAKIIHIAAQVGFIGEVWYACRRQLSELT